ncbi:MAG: hypothetical protein P8Y53_04205 [Pseudolabrys sp.]
MPTAIALRKLLLAVSLLAAALWLAAAPASAQAPAQPGKPVELVLFYGRGCPHCGAMRDYLATLKDRFPQLRVRAYEVYFDPANDRLFERMAHAYGIKIEGVPTAFLGDVVFAGYAEDMQPVIEQHVRQCIAQGCASPLTRVAAAGPAPRRALTLPAVLSGAAVDAINPCAFAVLIILIAGVLGAGGRRRALFAGFAFSLSIFISYYLMGLGLYSAVAAAGVTRALYVAVAVFAILIGLFNLKDYLWYGKWFVMEVPLSWRPRMKGILRRVTSVPGAFLVGSASWRVPRRAWTPCSGCCFITRSSSCR